MEIKVKKSDSFDDKIFLFVKMPKQISITAKPSILQQFIRPFNIELKIDITPENTYEQIWKIPVYVGMKCGRGDVTGTLCWDDKDNNRIEVNVDGVANIWNMRRGFI